MLVARGSGAEAGLPFAALIDLFDGVASEELAAVPAPQLRALEVALYRAEPTGRPPEPQVISLAVCSPPSARWPSDDRCSSRSTTCSGSTGPRGGARVRRAPAGTEPVRFLLGRRPGRRSALENGVPGERRQRVDVGADQPRRDAADPGDRLGLRLPHHVLRRVYDTTLGNPLFVLEVGRTLVFRDLDSLGEDIPLPDDVEDLLGLRVADLDDDVRRVLLALALGADLRVAQLRELAGPRLLERAIEAGVVSVDGERVRAAHPLLAAAARRRASDEERRGCTAGSPSWWPTRSAARCTSPWPRPAPDEELAARIEEAAERAAARGATRLASTWPRTPGGSRRPTSRRTTACWPWARTSTTPARSSG